jgi:DNA primase
MPGIDLRQVRREITIQHVLDLLGFAPTARQGSRLRGPCPIHGDCHPHSRVFSVHLGCHRYRCFRCHAAGTQLDLWAAVHGLSIYAAAENLCHLLGIPVPYLPSPHVGHHPGK